MSDAASDNDDCLRILILSADVGEGHIAAARALEEGLLERGGASVVHEDGLRFLGRPAQRLIRDGYRRQLRRAPESFNRLYTLWRSVPLLRAGGAWLLYRAGRRRLARRMRAVRPDVVVSTHPALTAALGRMRRRGQLRAVLCATITDLTENPMWCDPGTDLHVVMDPVAVPWVERHAGAGSAVAVRPLISPRFRRPGDAAQARLALDLPDAGSLVVVSGGGWGVGALDCGVAGALAAGADQVIALAGRNRDAAVRLTELFGDEPRVTVLGFTERMPELLRAADALVHGTGGMTSLEAVECGCPVIAFGTRLAHVQEHNRVLEELGLCTVAHDEHDLRRAVAEAVRRPRTERVPCEDIAERRPDAAAVVMAAVARVNPLPRWLNGLRRAATPLVCGAGLLWTVTTADAFSVASRVLHVHPLTTVPAWTDRLDLVVAAPAGREVADARMLARHGIHVTFSVTYRPAKALIAGVHAAGDDLIPALKSPGTTRWLGTSDDLSDLRSVLGGRRFLVPRGGMSLGQYVLARTAGGQPVAPAQLASRRPTWALRPGEIAVIGEKGPVSGTELLALVAQARDDGLRVAPLPDAPSHSAGSHAARGRAAVGRLIWRAGCQEGTTDFSHLRWWWGWCVVGWVGGGPAAVRDACQTDIRGCEGWLPGAAGPWFVVGCRCLMSSVASPERGGVLIVGSRVPRACRAATDPADGMSWMSVVGLFDLGDRPAESGEFAGGSDRDQRSPFVAGFQPRPGAMQS